MLSKLIGGALVCASMSSVAFAGGFVELGVGNGKVSGSGTECASAADVSCKKTGAGYKVGGGYMFNENVGAELAYYSMADLKATVPGYAGSVKLKTTGISVGALGAIPVAKDLKLLGRLGLVDASSKVSASGAFYILPGEATSKSSTNLYWGVGASYDVGSNVDLSLNYESFSAKNPGNEKYTASMFSLAAGYKF